MGKVVIIDNEGVMTAYALRCAEYGHDVKLFIEAGDDINHKTIAKGLHPKLEKVREWLPHVYGADLVITGDNAKYLKKLEMIRSRGVPVFAPSVALADLEIKRGIGLKFLEDHGVQVPEYKVFKSLKEAEKYVLDNPDRYVFKTLGSEEDKSLTYVGKSAQQLIQQLRDWQAGGASIKGDVMLQKFIPGEEIAVKRWLGPNGFLGPIEESFEHKKLYAGEKGENTGEMGTVFKYVSKSKLYDVVMAPLEADLVKLGGITSIDVNCIIDEDGNVWPLEFTCRCGWPQFNLELFAHKDDPLQWLIDMHNGKYDSKDFMDVIIGVCLVTKGFPTLNEDLGLAIYGLNYKHKIHIQPQFVKMGKFIDEVDGKLVDVEDWVTAGSYVAIACAHGKTVEEAQNKVYKTIDDISFSNLGYRTDIGDKVIKSLPILQKMGFAMDWEIEND